MDVTELDYDLPEMCIATHPASPRDAAKLMVIDRAAGSIAHRHVRDLPDLGALRTGDLLVVNRTQVLPAYLEGQRGGTGGRVTGLFLAEQAVGRWLVMLESRGKLQEGETIGLGEAAQLRLEASAGAGQWWAAVESELSTLALLERVGQTPLPPYIRKARKQVSESLIDADDASRYNTVFADEPGSVAAPTAGLHFTPELFDRLSEQGVEVAKLVLHVGIGTFAPIRSEDLAEHQMHAEWMDVPAETLAKLGQARQRGGRILAVGTTCVRALESLPEDAARRFGEQGFSSSTNLFIYPGSGHEFKWVDRLMTNFHLPRSTLIALVAALPGIGIDRMKQWYQLAVARGYRFYSYGDAMLIL